MLIKQVDECDFINYKKISMFIIFPRCSFKCDREFGTQICQNCGITAEPDIEIAPVVLVQKYISNPITKAVVCGGLEPFDSFDDLIEFVTQFRRVSMDDIVIYTGYYKNEIEEQIEKLSQFENIIIKFGRYKPNQEKHFDPVLGVYLASDNQYAEKIS